MFNWYMPSQEQLSHLSQWPLHRHQELQLYVTLLD